MILNFSSVPLSILLELQSRDTTKEKETKKTFKTSKDSKAGMIRQHLSQSLGDNSLLL